MTTTQIYLTALERQIVEARDEAREMARASTERDEAAWCRGLITGYNRSLFRVRHMLHALEDD